MLKKTQKTKPIAEKFLKISPPLDERTIKSLKIGDRVLISGIIYAARDSAHKLFGNKPPFETKGSIIYYASPTPAKAGKVIGSIGPTTAGRMDPFTPDLLRQGVKITIGKGRRSEEVKEAMKKFKAAYLVVPGGTAAALSKHVKKSTVLAFPELGPEAVLKLEVVNFPAIVAIDCRGQDLFVQGQKKYRNK